MISVKEQLPKEGEIVNCQVDYWRYGQKVSTELIQGYFEFFNTITNQLVFSDNIDYKYGDEAYANVTHWEYIKDD